MVALATPAGRTGLKVIGAVRNGALWSFIAMQKRPMEWVSLFGAGSDGRSR